MNAQATRPTPPAWLNIDAVIEPEERAELHQLAIEVVGATVRLEHLAERCFRALVVAERSASVMDDAGPDGYEAFRRWSGTGELLDALYDLRNTVDAARSERPDADPPGEWWARVRAEMGVTEWGVKVSDER